MTVIGFKPATCKPDLDEELSQNDGNEFIEDILLALNRIEFDQGREFVLPAELLDEGIEVFERTPAVWSSDSAALPRRRVWSEEHVPTGSAANAKKRRLLHRSSQDHQSALMAPLFHCRLDQAPHFMDLSAPVDADEIRILAKGAPSPPIAALLATLIPGLGHLYSSCEGAAVTVFAVVTAAVIPGHALLGAAWRGSRVGVLEPWMFGTAGVLFFMIAACVMLGSALSAYRAAAATTPYGRPRAKGHPWLASIASAVVPGWGQFLNDQPKKAAVFLGVAPILVVSALFFLPPAWGPQLVARCFPFIDAGMAASVAGKLGVIGVLGWILSIYDAGLVAHQRTRSRIRTPAITR